MTRLRLATLLLAFPACDTGDVQPPDLTAAFILGLDSAAAIHAPHGLRLLDTTGLAPRFDATRIANAFGVDLGEITRPIEGEIGMAWLEHFEERKDGVLQLEVGVARREGRSLYGRTHVFRLRPLDGGWEVLDSFLGMEY